MALKSEELIILNGSPYRVLPIEDGEKNGFLPGYAYHIKTQLTNKILPFIGKVKSFNDVDDAYGIYQLKKSNEYIVNYPPKDDDQYKASNIKTISNILDNVDFIETDIDLDVDGDTFNPPLRVDDDPMNKIVKIAISQKGIVLDAYKKRFDSVGGGGAKGNNNKNNAKRALLDNRSLSCNKAKEYGDVLDYQYAIILADKPDARHPMATDGRPLIIFSGDPFDISNSIDVSTMGSKIELDFNGDS